MGLDYHGIRFLAYLKGEGIKFEKSGMLGRQSLHADTSVIKIILNESKIQYTQRDIDEVLSSAGYAENLLKFFGSKNTHSFDNSNYEKCSFVHNFNHSIPEEFKEQYDFFLDGGSLEHIFNYSEAVKNCLKMVKIGGVFATITPCNNICGHGFYQFSPELYFSLLSPQNGFSLVKLFLYENSFDPCWYEVKSPKEVGNRINLTCRRPVMMLAAARKVAPTPDALIVQQSDYETIWDGGKLTEQPKTKITTTIFYSIKKFLGRSLTANQKIRLRRLIEPTPFKKDFYTKAKVFCGTKE